MSIEKVLDEVSRSGAALAMGYIREPNFTLSSFKDGLWITALFEQSEIRTGNYALFASTTLWSRTSGHPLFNGDQKFGTTWYKSARVHFLIPTVPYQDCSITSKLVQQYCII